MTCLWAAVIYLDLLFASLPASYLINPGSLQLGIPNYYYRTVNWHLTQLSVGLFVVKDTHQDRVCVMSISLVRHPTEVIEEKKQFTFPWRMQPTVVTDEGARIQPGEPTSCAYDDLHNSADQRHSHLEVMTAPPSALHLLAWGHQTPCDTEDSKRMREKRAGSGKESVIPSWWDHTLLR